VNVVGTRTYFWGAAGYSYNPDTDRKVFFNANFGQKPFTYTPPTGYVALCSKNISNEFVDVTDVSSEGSGKVVIRPQRFFDTVLYSGNGGTQSITGLEFSPDFVWIKMRSHSGDNHHLYDSVRGPVKTLFSNTTSAEQPNDTDRLTSFDSNGFTLGNNYRVNGSGKTFVAWCWKAGGAAVTNNDGSGTSQVSANQEAGFSIVTYSGNASGSASSGVYQTIGHGLGKAPKLIIFKARNGGESYHGWATHHHLLTDANTDYLKLNTTDARIQTDVDYMGSTLPTSSVFSLGFNFTTNESGKNYVAYCWTEIPGYSKMGVYRANNSSNGAYFYCGFRPAFIMLKNADNGSAPWYIIDNKRNPENECRVSLKANTTDGEVTDSNFIDFLSNGFKLRTSGGYVNNSYHRIFYMAFAEQPGRTEFNLVTNAR